MMSTMWWITYSPFPPAVGLFVRGPAFGRLDGSDAIESTFLF